MKKLLLIEDDPVAGRVYACRFQLEGYQIEVVPDNDRGLRTLPLFRPDAVVFDLSPPLAQAAEKVRRIRSQASGPSMPIVILAPAYPGALSQELKQAGASLCLVKAENDFLKLLDAVRSSLAGNSEAAREPAASASPAPGASAGSSPPKAAALAPLPSPASGPRGEFLKKAPQMLAALQSLGRHIAYSEAENGRREPLQDLALKANALAAAAEAAGIHALSRLGLALERLLKDLQANGASVPTSSLRTVKQACDFLTVLGKEPDSVPKDLLEQARILALEDETACLNAVQESLQLFGMSVVGAEETGKASELLQRNPFDLVISDVAPPGPNGSDFFKRFRALPAHRKTPLILLADANNVAHRLLCQRSGGDDYLSKPFLPGELAVKALVQLMRPRLKAPPPSFEPMTPL